MSVLTLLGRAHLTAERMHHKLQSVADAKHGQAKLEDASIGRRRVFVVDRPRRARQNNATRRITLDLVERGRAGQHDGENILFANAACDQLRVLRTKVENDDGFAELGLGFHR